MSDFKCNWEYGCKGYVITEGHCLYCDDHVNFSPILHSYSCCQCKSHCSVKNYCKNPPIARPCEKCIWKENDQWEFDR